MFKKKDVTFFVSGKEHTVSADDAGPQTTLNTYLRENLHLTGTKRMCLEGGCGTCTVAVEETVDGVKSVISVKSCLVSILSCHGWQIHTIEGIGNPLIGYHQVQKILSDNYGTQCGFCSPGMVMNMYALQESGPVTKEQIEDSFGGNICRCTGYRPILNAFKKLSSNSSDENFPDIEELKMCPKIPGIVCANTYKQEEKINFLIELADSKWMKVHTLKDLLDVIDVYATENYILVCGNTARGVYKNGPIPNLYIDIREVAELTQYTVNPNRLLLGANITLTNFIKICKKVSSKYKNFLYLADIAQHLNLVATLQIRNLGSIAGNLMIKHEHNEFPSDVFLLLETFKASLIIVDDDNAETFSTPQDFLNMDMTKKVIKNIVLNPLDSSYRFATYKIMRRAQNDHAMVNAGFLVQMNSNSVVSARLVYGGINPKFVHASKSEKSLVGKNLYENSTLQIVFNSLNEEIQPDYVLPDPTPEFRKKLSISLFYKFVLKTCPPNLVSARCKSGGHLLQRPLSTGSQEYGTNQKEWPLTQPVLKLGSLSQTSGQTEYIMDMPALPKQVYAAFVTSKAKAGSVIGSVDASEALKMEGVIAYYDKKDIPGINNFTPPNVTNFVQDEELFCSGVVQYYYQPIGIIVGKTQEIAWKAADIVKVKYEASEFKAYLNVKEVVKDNAQERITNLMTVLPKRKGKDIKQVIKGDFYVGHQYHFHMEVQGCKAVPNDDDGFDIFPTTQWMDAVQLAVAAVLGISESKINIQVRRLGGAFGAKISRNSPIAAASALAAFKLKVPVKMDLSLEDNMNIIGKRWPLYAKYEVGVNDKGLIQYMNANLYSDFGLGGNDPFTAVLMNGFENCYDLSTWDYSVNKVKTDTHANTYCRAPGHTEGVACIESIMDEIAYTLNLDPKDVRSVNLIPDAQIPKYLANLNSWAQIDQIKQDVDIFNKANRWTKRGLSVVPLKWDLTFTSNYTVLVSIFHGDGSVALSHGGIEMGQGINTKAAQVCAYKFGISLDQVSVKASQSLIAPNSYTTGTSQTSEAICFGIIKACDTLLERMKPIRDKMTNPTWPELVKSCFEKNVQLNSTGFFYEKDPAIQTYPIYAACVVEVEVDALTGQHQILKADILEDLGQSMSPIIDIGQIEGAFVMGLGYHTLEELIYDEEGKLLTNRTWNYKPPGAKDIPINFRVKFAENSFNPGGILNSKAVAEPPLVLSIAVPLAIRNAVASARQEADATIPKWVPINGPTTVEKTYIYCSNNYKQYVI